MGMPSGSFLNIRLGGQIPGDRWSCGLWWQMDTSATFPTPTQMNVIANKVLADFKTIFWAAGVNGYRAHVSTGTTLLNSVAYLYVNGVLSSQGAGATASSPGTGVAPQPSYTARCVTLLTDTPGRSTRGRLYLPHNGQAPGATDGLFPSMLPELTNFKTFIDTTTAANYFTSPSNITPLVVVSATHAKSTIITTLRCDNKPDTQRGRQSKLVATVTDSVAA